MTFEELVEEVRIASKDAKLDKVNEHLAYQINIEGEASGIFYIEISEGKVNVEPYEYYDRDAIIITKADTFLKIMNGKLNPVQAFLTGKIKVEGDLGKAAMLEKII